MGRTLTTLVHGHAHGSALRVLHPTPLLPPRPGFFPLSTNNRYIGNPCGRSPDLVNSTLYFAFDPSMRAQDAPGLAAAVARNPDATVRTIALVPAVSGGTHRANSRGVGVGGLTRVYAM